MRPLRYLCLMILLSTIGGCSLASFYSSRSYKGIVLDEETNQPIVGALVSASWRATSSGCMGHCTKVYDFIDSQEMLTDENGSFQLVGWGPRFWGDKGALNNYDPMVIVLKQGYKGRSTHLHSSYNGGDGDFPFSGGSRLAEPNLRTIHLKKQHYPISSKDRWIENLGRTMMNRSWPSNLDPSVTCMRIPMAVIEYLTLIDTIEDEKIKRDVNSIVTTLLKNETCANLIESNISE